MSRKLLRRSVSVAIVFGVGLGASTTHAQDRNRGPADTLVVCGVTTVTTAPSQIVYGCAFNNSGATYDLKSGQFSVGATGNGAEAELNAEDKFAGAMDVGYATARIGSGDQAQEFNTIMGDSYQILTLPMSQAAGEHFRLAVHLHAVSLGARRAVGYENQATASARLTFVLPPGYVITSNQGYSSLPTPAHATTWGRLKTIYR